jgi:acetylornithine deacetylase/succinyl-diaminopimelate desuccinylase-like protein
MEIDMASSLEPVLAHIESDQAGALTRWQELLRFPSIGTDPAYARATREAAEWLARYLAEIGCHAEVRDTPGQPMVVAHQDGPGEGAPHVLYYGHYDVQPPEPVELWESPPFEPTLKDGPHGRRMVARGAVDDKGQLMTWLEALRAWHAVHGRLPVAISVFIEGEEESGSPSLEPFLAAHREELGRADVCVVSDTIMWNVDVPSICTLLRGLLYVDLTLSGPSHDLHSGLYGGAVLNPLNVLTRILGGLHDGEGRVRIPGFYEDVREPDPSELRRWAELGFDETAFLASVGLRTPTGEAGRSALERLWSRPTCDLNGIWGGYTGEGTKTVIPARAHAKLSCRLVPEQDPQKVLAGLRRFLDERAPPDARIEITTHGVNPAMRVPTDSPYLGAARRALAATFGREPALIGMGGSIPAVEAMNRLLGIDSLLIGFGLEDDRVHSPNEKFELVCFERGVRSHARLLAELGALS